MLLIADSGFTKTYWKLVDNSTEYSFQTLGINPFYMTDEEIESKLKNIVVPQLKKSPDKIYFYSADICLKRCI